MVIYVVGPLLLMFIILLIKSNRHEKRIRNRNNKMHEERTNEFNWKGRTTEKDWINWYNDITHN